jgi:SEC-C motif domain protein
MTPCPCGSGEAYGACCGRFHAGERAVTAEQLMRSRFAAFVLGDEAYLRRTWHRSTRPRRLELDPTVEWTHLEIVDRVAGGPLDTDGIVEFRAHHRVGGRAGAQAERSRFVREDGAWLYLTAE